MKKHSPYPKDRSMLDTGYPFPNEQSMFDEGLGSKPPTGKRGIEPPGLVM